MQNYLTVINSAIPICSELVKSEQQQSESHDSHAEYHAAYGKMMMTVFLGTRQKLVKEM